MKKRARRNRGVAVIAVIIVYTLISAALVAMMVVFADQAQRTRATTAGTQIRQLLLAATPLTQMELQTHGASSRDINIAVPVDKASLKLTIIPLTPDRVEVQVFAEYLDHKGVQTLSFARQTGPSGAAPAPSDTASIWKLVDTQLVLSP